MAHEPSAWERIIAENPAHSDWYIQRFRTMAAQGNDIVGEARMIDAMVPRGSRILDAGCGPGRLGGYLHQAGHTVVGVDVDPTLIQAAEADHPGPTWIAANLADLSDALTGADVTGEAGQFDAIVCAGNVMTFVAPSTRRGILGEFAAHLAPQGRAAIGFGGGRGYEFEAFRQDAAAAGLREDLLLSTWDLRPFDPAGNFIVAVFSRA